ncbi:MAG: ribosome silencing factor [Fusobacteriota bacterium]
MKKKLETVKNAIEDKKGKDIKIISLKQNSVTENVVLVTGTSKTHIKGIADEIDRKLYKENEHPIGKEGYNEGKWILLDYNDIVIHIFNKELREKYNIEEALNIDEVLRG